jgi:cell division protein FtsB
VTRSKEMRRINEAITHRNESELKWALAQCELRKRFQTRHIGRWHQLEKQIRALLAELEEKSD